MQNACVKPGCSMRRSSAHPAKQLKRRRNAISAANSGHCTELFEAPVRTRYAAPRCEVIDKRTLNVGCFIP